MHVGPQSFGKLILHLTYVDLLLTTHNVSDRSAAVGTVNGMHQPIVTGPKVRNRKQRAGLGSARPRSTTPPTTRAASLSFGRCVGPYTNVSIRRGLRTRMASISFSL